jgi:P2-related tail formation protein
MSSYLRATHLIDLCTSSISYDRQVQAACKAFDEQMFEIIDDTGQVIMIPNIMNIDDENLINILAWQFHVDFYDTTKDLEFRKRLVQMSIVWHKTKGTLDLVQEVIDTYWPGGAHIEEWFDYKWPFPPNYPTSPPDTLVAQFGSAGVNVTLNRFDITAHGLTNNQVIRFTANAGARLPATVIAGVWYYVRNATANNFQIGVMTTGPLVVLTDVGNGVMNVWLRATGPSWHDRYKFRIQLDEDVITPEETQAVLSLIDRYKPVSRWCEGIFRALVSQCDIGVTGMLLRFIYRESDHPDDWSPGPEPPVPPTFNAYLNKVFDPLTIESDAEDHVRANLSETLLSGQSIAGSVLTTANVTKTLSPLTLLGHISGQTNPHKVHFVYLIPSDCSDRASARIQQMAYELQRFMRWRMGNGKTFTLHDPVVEAFHTDHAQSWYPNNNAGGDQSGWYWSNTLADLARYAGGGFYQFYDTWFVYVDAEPNPGQYAGGTGGGYTSGCCVLGWRDLNALMGIDPQWTVCREIGGAGHEYLHTHSAPHAETEYWTQSIMGTGYTVYPNCILQPSLIALLNANPFYTELPPEQMHHPLVLCPFDDGLGA